MRSRNVFQSLRDQRSTRKYREPDLRWWEFPVQMLCSAYLSWRWLGKGARFAPWRANYWTWLAQYSSLTELRVRASLADRRWSAIYRGADLAAEEQAEYEKRMEREAAWAETKRKAAAYDRLFTDDLTTG